MACRGRPSAGRHQAVLGSLLLMGILGPSPARAEQDAEGPPEAHRREGRHAESPADALNAPRPNPETRGEVHVPSGYGEGASQRTFEPPRKPSVREPPRRPQEPLTGEEPPNSLVTADPVLLIAGFLRLAYERGLGDHVSIYAGPALLLFDTLDTYDDDLLLVGAQAGLRFFPAGNARAPQGFWLGPGADVWYARVGGGSGSDTAFAYAVGGLVGYTWIWGRFVLSLGGGVQYFQVVGDASDIENLQPTTRGSIGLAF